MTRLSGYFSSFPKEPSTFIHNLAPSASPFTYRCAVLAMQAPSSKRCFEDEAPDLSSSDLSLPVVNMQYLSEMRMQAGIMVQQSRSGMVRRGDAVGTGKGRERRGKIESSKS